MSLNKKKMVREIGRRTRLSNRDVQRVIETLVEMWTEELVNGGRIEIEHFAVIDTKIRERHLNDSLYPERFRVTLIRASKALREQLNERR